MHLPFRYLLLSFFVATASAATALRDDGTVLVDNQPFLPVGCFVNERWSAGSYKAMIDAHAAASMNTVYLNTLGTSQAEYDSVYDYAASKGVHIIQTANLGSEYRDFYKSLMQRYANHPATLMWYVRDDAHDHPAEESAAISADARSIDPTHLTTLSFVASPWRTWTREGVLPYIDASDVPELQMYPIPQKPVDDVWTDLAVMVSAAAERHKPIIAVPQTFNWKIQFDWGRWPTGNEVGVMGQLALMSGVRGMLFYTYDDLERAGEVGINSSQPEVWASMTRLSRESATAKNFLLNGQRTATAAGSNRYQSTWRIGDDLLVMAANTSLTESRRFEIAIPVSASATVNPLLSGSAVSLAWSNGLLTGDLPPMSTTACLIKLNAAVIVPPLVGDVNGDGVVNAADLSIVNGQFGRSGSAITDSRADRDGNGRVDAVDIGTVTRAVGQ